MSSQVAWTHCFLQGVSQTTGLRYVWGRLVLTPGDGSVSSSYDFFVSDADAIYNRTAYTEICRHSRHNSSRPQIHHKYHNLALQQNTSQFITNLSNKQGAWPVLYSSKQRWNNYWQQQTRWRRRRKRRLLYSLSKIRTATCWCNYVYITGGITELK